jgi:hypothetical protein
MSYISTTRKGVLKDPITIQEGAWRYYENQTIT